MIDSLEMSVGFVLSVVERREGTYLTEDSLADDDTLYVYDIDSFSEDGGTARVFNDDKTVKNVITYGGFDEDISALIGVTGLTDAFAAGDQVLAQPAAVTRYAAVVESEEDGPVDARVPHSLYPHLRVGTRGYDEGTTTRVAFFHDGFEFVIFDILGAVPLLPIQPDVATIEYEYDVRDQVIRGHAIVTVPEVTTDTEGAPLVYDIHHYGVQLQPSTSALLSSSISASRTSFVVDTSPTIPDVPFVAYIRDEAILVTDWTGTTITATRGYDGTTAAPHRKGARVQFFPPGAHRQRQNILQPDVDDPDDFISARFPGIRHALYYRARSRVVDRAGRFGYWSDWNEPTRAKDPVQAPAPFNVRFSRSIKRVGLQWDAPDDPDADDDSFVNPITITAATESGTTATITTQAVHNLIADDVVQISGMTPSGYNGTWPVDSIISAKKFTVMLTSSGLGAGSVFGTVARGHSQSMHPDIHSFHVQVADDEDYQTNVEDFRHITHRSFRLPIEQGAMKFVRVRSIGFNGNPSDFVSPSKLRADWADGQIIAGWENDVSHGAWCLQLDDLYEDQRPVIEAATANDQRLTIMAIYDAYLPALSGGTSFGWRYGHSPPANYADCFDLDDLKSFEDDGHEIANHTYSHISMSDLTPEQRMTEWDTTSDLIEAAGIRRPTTFAYPFGYRDIHTDREAVGRFRVYRYAGAPNPIHRARVNTPFRIGANGVRSNLVSRVSPGGSRIDDMKDMLDLALRQNVVVSTFVHLGPGYREDDGGNEPNIDEMIELLDYARDIGLRVITVREAFGSPNTLHNPGFEGTSPDGQPRGWTYQNTGPYMTVDSAADIGAGNIGAGSYRWAASYETAQGESPVGLTLGYASLTVGASRKVRLSGITRKDLDGTDNPEPTNATGIKIWRTKAGTTTPYYYVGTITPTGATSYTFDDNLADASLGAEGPEDDTTVEFEVVTRDPMMGLDGTKALKMKIYGKNQSVQVGQYVPVKSRKAYLLSGRYQIVGGTDEVTLTEDDFTRTGSFTGGKWDSPDPTEPWDTDGTNGNDWTVRVGSYSDVWITNTGKGQIKDEAFSGTPGSLSSRFEHMLVIQTTTGGAHQNAEALWKFQLDGTTSGPNLSMRSIFRYNETTKKDWVYTEVVFGIGGAFVRGHVVLNNSDTVISKSGYVPIPGLSPASTTDYWVRSLVQDDQMMVKVWEDDPSDTVSAGEPDDWTAVWTDPMLINTKFVTDGMKFGLAFYGGGSGITMTVDNYKSYQVDKKGLQLLVYPQDMHGNIIPDSVVESRYHSRTTPTVDTNGDPYWGFVSTDTAFITPEDCVQLLIVANLTGGDLTWSVGMPVTVYLDHMVNAIAKIQPEGALG